ncbi:hypothetical protein [Geodermatophilus sp. URMC 62]|uniref:hypothetical protein n=1 Tax=Geodermatophilus sp. URMC 62 TaxID=3423414 RepID=UPI00406CB34D
MDIVDKNTFDTSRGLVYEYLQEQFHAKYMELSIQHTVDGAAGLRTLWSSSENQELSTTIRNADGAYSTQSALCFGEKKKLWIVDADKGPLRTTSSCHDLWSGVTDLPAYRPPVDNASMFTSVLIPICRPNNRILGVLNVESARYYEFDDFDPDEMFALADALGVLYDLFEIHKLQAQGTRDAMDQLRKIRSSASSPRSITPQVFISFSDRADDRVVGILLDVLQGLESHPRIVTWQEIDASGQIGQQIDDAINASHVGVCYLSEPNGQGGFEDNDNVLIEVGMFRERDVTQKQATCLLVREKASPQCPFNVASDRILYVPRTGNGVNEPMLRAELESRLKWLMLSAG